MFSIIRFRPRKAYRRPPRTTPNSAASTVSQEVTSRAARGLKAMAKVRDLKARDLARAVRDRTSRPRSQKIRG